MPSLVEQYREFERRLEYVRLIHGGLESPEEDDLIDQLQSVWDRLTQDERDRVRREGFSPGLLNVAARVEGPTYYHQYDVDLHGGSSGPHREVVAEVI